MTSHFQANVNNPASTTFMSSRILLSFGVIGCIFVSLHGGGELVNALLDTLARIAGPRNLADFFLAKFGKGTTALTTVTAGYLTLNLIVVAYIAWSNSKSLRQAQWCNSPYVVKMGNRALYAFYGCMIVSTVVLVCAMDCNRTSPGSNGTLLMYSALVLVLFVLMGFALYLLESSGKKERARARNPLHKLRYVTYGPAVLLATIAYTPGNVAIASGLCYLLYSTKVLSTQIDNY